MKRTLKHYSQSFKQQVLDDYFQSGMSQAGCCQKWNIPLNYTIFLAILLQKWVKKCIFAF